MYDSRRTHERYSSSSPIIYSNSHNTQESYPAKMVNKSIGGMCFKSDAFHHKDFVIYIKSLKQNINKSKDKDPDVYLGKVKWIKSKPGNFGVGVQFLSAGWLFPKLTWSCNFCGKSSKGCGLHKMDNELYVCKPCYIYLGTMDDGYLKDNVMSFLIGNVI